MKYLEPLKFSNTLSGAWNEKWAENPKDVVLLAHPVEIHSPHYPYSTHIYHVQQVPSVRHAKLSVRPRCRPSRIAFLFSACAQAAPRQTAKFLIFSGSHQCSTAFGEGNKRKERRQWLLGVDLFSQNFESFCFALLIALSALIKAHLVVLTLNIVSSCNKTVYFAERINAAGKDYHKIWYGTTRRLNTRFWSELSTNISCASFDLRNIAIRAC